MNPRTSFDSDLAPIEEEGEDELAAHAMHVVGDDDDDEEKDEEEVAEKGAEEKEEPEEKILDGLAELEEMAKKQLENPEDSPIKGDYDE